MKQIIKTGALKGLVIDCQRFFNVPVNAAKQNLTGNSLMMSMHTQDDEIFLMDVKNGKG